MKKIIIIIIFVVVLFTHSFSLANTEYCKIDVGDGNSWEGCKNKAVKIIGRLSDSPMQHPTGLHNSFDITTNKIKKKFENYIDINGIQIVLTSDEEINCKGRIEVEGIVDIVDLNGPEGTKQGYKNVWIKVINFQCIK